MIKSKKHLCRILKTDWQKLQALCEDLDKYYYEKSEQKFRNGKPRFDNKGLLVYRVLHPSKGKLKLIQQRIKSTVLDKIEYPNYIMGGVKGRDNVKNARMHKGKPFKFITDLTDFFPSVTPNHVYKGLQSLGFSADVASILTKLMTYKGGVPQGAPTSTHAANIAFMSVDKDIKEVCLREGITYSRFVDDLSFSSQNDFRGVSLEIVRIIKKANFRISHRKTTYAKGSLEITGARVRNNILTPTDKLKNKLDNPEGYNEFQVTGHKRYKKRLKAN